MLMIGSIVGAGFASGREIVAFFGSDISPLVAVFCGLGIFAVSAMLLTIGNKVGKDSFGEVNQQLLGKFSGFADIFLLLNGFIVLSGMLAGMDSLFDSVLPLSPAYSVISGIICVLIVMKGVDRVMKGSGFIVPVIIACLMTVCLFNYRFDLTGGVVKNLPAAVIYVSMNMVLSSTVFTTMRKYTQRQILGASAITGGAIGLIMYFIIVALNKTQTYPYPMPIIEIAKSTSTALYVLSVIAVAVGIFTTMMTAMSGLTGFFVGYVGSRAYAAVIVLFTGLIVSNLGFENVIGYLYPLIGVVGLLYIIVCFAYLTRNRYKRLSKAAKSLFDNGHDDVHKGGKKAKDKGRGHYEIELKDLSSVND